MIKGLHHNAYRCRDSEETRAFYEGAKKFQRSEGIADRCVTTLVRGRIVVPLAGHRGNVGSILLTEA